MKQKIRLTESQLYKIIKESVTRIITESKYKFVWDEECDENGVITATIKGMDGEPAIFECTLNYEDESFYYATAICVNDDLYGKGYELDIEIDKDSDFNAVEDAIIGAIDADEAYMYSRGEYQ